MADNDLHGIKRQTGGFSMAHTKDFIPGPDAKFDVWLVNLTAYVDAKTTSSTWTYIPVENVTALKGRNMAWHTAYVKTIGPHTAVDTETKNESRKRRGNFCPVLPADRTSGGLGVWEEDSASCGELTFLLRGNRCILAIWTLTSRKQAGEVRKMPGNLEKNRT
jgi:hypothetical protein